MADRRTHALWLGCAVVLLVGCAGVPTSGSVHLGGAPPSLSGLDDRDIRAFAPGPVPGQTQKEVVTQFLDAMVDSDNNYDVARRFLAADTSWSSASRVTIYSQESLTVRSITKTEVLATLDQTGVIDARGTYDVAPRPRNVRFRLTRQRGQWRVSHLPSGVFLSSSDALQSLESANLYFFNLAQNRLVAAPILVPPDQPGLATVLVNALLDGPDSALRPAVVSAAPSTVALIGNVPIDSDGTAEVNLSGGFQAVSAVQLQRLSAQIVWTLRQVPSVTGVRLLDNGTPLSDVGVPRLQLVDSWQQFDPDAAPTSAGALLVRRQHIIGIGHLVPKPFAGRVVSAPAFSAGGARVAALRAEPHGASLLVGSSLGPLHVRLIAPALASPQFDPAGNVYVVSGIGPAAAVLKVPPDGAPRPVQLPDSVSAQGVDALSVSRDGARIALVVGPSGQAALLVGSLSTVHGEPRVSGVTTVVPADRDVRGVAWQNAGQLVTTVASTANRRSVLRVSIDGYRPHLIDDSGLPPAPAQVAAAPGQPLLVEAGGAVWGLHGHSWARVSTGSDPSYAG